MIRNSHATPEYRGPRPVSFESGQDLNRGTVSLQEIEDDQKRTSENRGPVFGGHYMRPSGLFG